MLIYYTLGVVGLLMHLQSEKESPSISALAGLRPRWQYFARILGVASLSSTANPDYQRRFDRHNRLRRALRCRGPRRIWIGISSRTSDLFHGARAGRWYDDNGWHLCRRRQRSPGASHYIHLVWAGGGYLCDGRARRCAFGTIDRPDVFTHAERVVFAASSYFRVTGFTYGFMASLHGVVFGLSGLGTRDRSVAGKPAQAGYRIDRGLDVASATVGPARLALCNGGGFHSYRSVNSGHGFCVLAAKSTQWRAFRLKRRPAFITQGLHPLQFCRGGSLEFDCRASTKDRRSPRILRAANCRCCASIRSLPISSPMRSISSAAMPGTRR